MADPEDPEVKNLLAISDKLARAMNGRFEIDPDKVVAFPTWEDRTKLLGRQRVPGTAQRRVTYGQYMVQMREAELQMQAYVNKILEDNPGWQFRGNGQFVDADGNDVGIWVE